MAFPESMAHCALCRGAVPVVKCPGFALLLFTRPFDAEARVDSAGPRGLRIGKWKRAGLRTARPGHCLVILRGGGGGLFGALASPRPTQPPNHIRKMCLPPKKNLSKGLEI